MVENLTTSGAGVQVVVGKAGTGKTFALDAARAAWQAGGHKVIGAALAARAAAELQSGSGIACQTVDRLLNELDTPGPLSGLAPRTMIVVDEAGMVGTRKLARLLDHAQRYQAQVVLVGDHRQLPEIEAGGIFAALVHRLDPVELTINRRQEQAWERRALDQMRSGTVTEAVSAARAAEAEARTAARVAEQAAKAAAKAAEARAAEGMAKTAARASKEAIKAAALAAEGTMKATLMASEAAGKAVLYTAAAAVGEALGG